MAITLHTEGSWVAANATTQTVTLPTHSTGDMLIVRCGMKHATMPGNITCGTLGWQRIDLHNSGTGASSNGGGDVQIAAFWKVAASGAETNPVITYHATVAATPSAAVATSIQKAAGEIWSTPLGDSGTNTTALNFSATMASHVVATAGDFLLGFTVTNDNTALTVPTFSMTTLTLAAVVESPATALSSGTSNDIAADGCYRIATANTSTAAAVYTGTNSAADIGASMVIRLRVAAADPITSLPTAASLTLSAGTPTVATTANTTSLPTAAALTLSAGTPTVLAPAISQPTASALTLSAGTPTVLAPAVSLPTADALTLSAGTPTVVAIGTASRQPTPVALVLSTGTPAILTPVLSAPTTASLSLSAGTPSVLAPAISLPSAVALTLSAGTPAVTAPALTQPTSVELTLTAGTPSVVAAGAGAVTSLPTAASLTLSVGTPTVAATANVRALPTAAVLTVTGATPAVAATANIVALPTPAALILKAGRPVVIALGKITAAVGAWEPPPERLPRPMRSVLRPAHLVLVGAAPDVRIIDDGDILDMLAMIA